MYQVRFSSQAKKFFRKLPRDIQSRIKSKFREVLKDPFRFLEHYEGEGYKLRIGSYRALIDIDFKDNVMFARVLDKRGRIYK